MMHILSLSTYPISTTLHGGQRRVSALCRVAADHGHRFTNAPFFFVDEYPDATEQERQTGLDPALKTIIAASGGAMDADISDVIDMQSAQVSHLRTLVQKQKPDMVQFEHPWLFPLWKRLCDEDPEIAKIPMIYSSHNVEQKLCAPQHVSKVSKLERALCKASTVILTVSESDAKTLRKWTSKKTPIVVAPNGSWPHTSAQHSHRIIPEDYVVLAGSAHPPNAKGLWDTFGMVPGCIPPDGKLAIVGGMNNLLWDDPRHQKFRKLQDSVIYYAGVVPEEGLNVLLDQAKGICLPITSGGGTNLKTAEALLRLKPIVAMRKAFRGFEAFSELSGVYIADTREDFQSLIRMLFAGQLESKRTAEDVKDLTWDACLLPAISALNARQTPRGTYP